MEGIAARRIVVASYAAARFDRAGDDAVIYEIERNDLVSPCELRVRAGLVPNLPIERAVSLRMRPDGWQICIERRREVGGRGERVVGHLDQRSCIPGNSLALRHYDRDRLTNIADAIPREGGPWRNL